MKVAVQLHDILHSNVEEKLCTCSVDSDWERSPLHCTFYMHASFSFWK